MLRPLLLDIFALLLPLSLGALAFWVGRSPLRRSVCRLAMMTLAVVLLATAMASVFPVLPDEVTQLLSWAGGTTVLLSWVALYLLGIAWTSPGRRVSSGFLACLAGVAGCLLFIESSGALWWRFCAPELWQRTPDTRGRLRQSSGLTCSPTAAAMLLNRYGIRASEGEMAYLAGTSLFGTDAQAMADALQRKVQPHAWQVRAHHTDYEDCLRRGQPFLAHVQGPYLGHAVLVERVTQEGVEFVDPLEGAPRQLSRAEFERAWDGTVVEVYRRGD